MGDKQRILKYHRIQGAVARVATNEIITAADVHQHGIVIGSTGGFVYILDEEGNDLKTLKPHTRAVTAIFVDASGQTMISCSEDRSVAVIDLTSGNEEENVMHFDEPVTAVCFDGGQNSKNENSFALGMALGQLIHHKESWFTQKNVTLFQGAGSPVTSVVWRGPLIAWADATCVRILDVERSVPVCAVPRPDTIGVDMWYPSALHWESDSDLLVGWGDTVQRLEMIHSVASVGDAVQSSTTAEITEEWKTDFVICGLSPFDADTLLLLGYVPSDTPDVPAMPEIQIVKRGTGELVRADAIPVKDYGRNPPSGYQLCTTYKLKSAQNNLHHWRLKDVTSIRGGMRGLAPVMYVVSPTDVILVRVRDTDDRISSALEAGDIEEAVNLAASDKNSLRRHKFQELVKEYFDLLLEKERFQKAANEARRLLGMDASLWGYWVAEFARRKCLPALAPFIPTEHPRLGDQIYELVLSRLLVDDSQTLLATIRRWGFKQPPLYNIRGLLSSLEALVTTHKDPYLLQTQAELYVMTKQYQRALQCYLEMDPGSQSMDDADPRKHFKDAFQLIERENLFEAVKDKVYNLVRLSKELAGNLLAQNIDKFPVALVVNQLQGDRQLLLWYLDLLFTRCQQEYNSDEYREYHVLQISLYAEFAPPFVKPTFKHSEATAHSGDTTTYKPYESDFLDFLKICKYAPYDEAIIACDRRDPPLFHEKAYALSRTQNTQEALRIYVQEIGDIRQALEFVVATDKNLWPELVDLCLHDDELLASVLDHVGYYSLNPAVLSQKLSETMKVDGLQRKLMKVMSLYGFQMTLHDRTKNILQAETLTLLRNYNQGQRRAFKLDPGVRCAVCSKPLYLPFGPPVGDINSQQFPIRSGVDSSLDIWGKQDPTGAVVLSHRLVLHRPCLDFVMRDGLSPSPAARVYRNRNGSDASSLTSPSGSFPAATLNGKN